MLTCARGSCAIVMGVLALAGLMAGCASEKAKVNVPFKLFSSSGMALEKIQVTFLSKDGARSRGCWRGESPSSYSC